MWRCLLGVLLFIPGVYPGPRYSSRIVETESGQIRGIIRELPVEPVEYFLGVPYAAPPVGERRLRPPRPPLAWSGTRLADTPAPFCPQPPPLRGLNATAALQLMPKDRFLLLSRLQETLADQSEDCLTLNIYVPASGSRGEDAPYAIMVYIHGESYEWGGGHVYDVSVWSSLGHVIAVTVNYRLGLLGFLKLQGSCCLALRDIEEALSWLRRNIASFGGDPGRVTLVGHDTGAALINALLLSDTAAGLFHRAILLSGSLLCPWAVAARPDITTAHVAAQLACPLGPELTECLRRTSLSRILSLDLPSPRFLSTFGPWFPGDVRAILDRAGDTFISRPLMVGVASTESYLELNNHQVQEGVEEDQRNRILRTFVRNTFVYHLNELFSTVRNEYTDWDKPIIHPINLRDSLLEALSDGHTVSPVVRLALTHSRRGSTTYMLHFNYQTKETDYIQRLGSLRGEIIPYLLGFPLVGGDPLYPANHTHADIAVSEHLLTLATRFARTGDPNRAVRGKGGSDISRSRDDHHHGLHWDTYNPNTQLYLSLGTRSRMRSHYRGHKMSVWLNLIPQLHRPGDRDVAMRHHHFQERDHRHYDGAVRPETLTHITTPSTTTLMAEKEDCENTTDEEGQPQPSTEDRNTPVPLAPETAPTQDKSGVGATVVVGVMLSILNAAVISATLWLRRRQHQARMSRKLEELGTMSVATFSRNVPPATPVRTSSLGHRTPLDDEISV
ncbi:neuroligin-1-like [Macrosteles quadrilineatus]|uniref:neuroligin-1-like n=1 Tax=Macrosteles quadrilineatus TaxID=74068 RepID=UPI0023E16577|nr:neuroligin-1-like [Macrosteles quadrilineatus]